MRPLPADAFGADGVPRPLLLATLPEMTLSKMPAPVWSARAIPQPPGLLLVTLPVIRLCDAAGPRSSAMLMPTPFPLARFLMAVEYDVLLRSIPEPLLFLTVFPEIVT